MVESEKKIAQELFDKQDYKKEIDPKIEIEQKRKKTVIKNILVVITIIILLLIPGLMLLAKSLPKTHLILSSSASSSLQEVIFPSHSQAMSMIPIEGSRPLIPVTEAP